MQFIEDRRQPYTPYQSNEDCPSCQKTMANKSVFAHSGKHPMHSECIKNWLKQHQTCPTCHDGVKFDEARPLENLAQRARIVYEVRDLLAIKDMVESKAKLLRG